MKTMSLKSRKNYFNCIEGKTTPTINEIEQNILMKARVLVTIIGVILLITVYITFVYILDAFVLGYLLMFAVFPGIYFLREIFEKTYSQRMKWENRETILDELIKKELEEGG